MRVEDEMMEDQRSAGHEFEDDWNLFDPEEGYILAVYYSLYGSYWEI